MVEHSVRTPERLLATGIIAIVRTQTSAGLLDAFAALLDGGVELVEVTLTTPEALALIERARRRFGDDLTIGAGTVLTSSEVAAAATAGASFVVSPAVDEEVIAATLRVGLIAIPGCLSPTEVAVASRQGAHIIKLFPARVATPEYLKDLRGPFPNVSFVPTGTIDLEIGRRFFEVGALGVGIGKALLNPRSIDNREWSTITRTAKAFRQMADEGRALQS